MPHARPLLLLVSTALAQPLLAQASAGNELWRLAAVTLPVPPALATGATAAFWNPAQRDAEHGRLGVELIQTPEAIGAAGVIAALGIPVRRAGTLGLVYARMGIGYLVRTIDTPDPGGAAIPYYAQSAALTWARGFGRSAIGASLAYRETRLDGATITRWSLDAGIVHGLGDRVSVAAATRGLRRIGSDAAQDVYAGIDCRLWRGLLWHDVPGTVRARYGLTAGHPGGADHQFGAGLDIGTPVALDVVLAREATYGHTGWRGAVGVRVLIGRYRLSLARDGGVSDLGSTFRVGLEARLR